MALSGLLWLLASTWSLGAVASFTSRSQWLASLPGIPSVEDTYEDLREDFYASPLRRKGYIAVASNGLYVGKIGGSKVLSTNKPDRIYLHFSVPVVGIGLRAGITDFDFSPVFGALVYKLGDMRLVRQSTGLSFFGITSDDPFTGLAIELQTQTPAGLYPTLDNLEYIIYTPPKPVPEPHSLAVLLGLGGVGWFLKLRKRTTQPPPFPGNPS